MVSSDAIIAYTDGGARGNPGPAGFGVHIESADGRPIAQLHEALGVATNNVAEYRALLAALAWALDHGYRRLHVRSDSQLLVCQMRGEYKVKNPGLQALHREARALAGRLEHVAFEHIPRTSNREADRLANLAMDEAAAGRRTDQPFDSPASDAPARGKRPTTNNQRPPGLPFDDDLPDNPARSKK
jgi:probable phosphoglycerate mutase